MDGREPRSPRPASSALSQRSHHDAWALVGPLIPQPKPGGNKRKRDMREIVDALMSVLIAGCQWRAIPKDLPPRSTVSAYFDLWDDEGTRERIHRVLYAACREQAGCEASPTVAVIDADEKIKGKRCHVLVDAQGPLMQVLVHRADTQDRDGGVLLVATLFVW